MSGVAATAANPGGGRKTALRDANRLEHEGKLQEALWAIRRAEPLYTAGLLSQEFEQTVRERQMDLEMLNRLNAIRLEKAIAGADDFDFSQTASDYEAAFRDYGIDVQRLDPQEAARRIKARSIAQELAAALQDWAIACKTTQPKNDTTWKELLAVACAADPDDTQRNEIRDALQRGDKKVLKELTNPGQTAALSPGILVLLGNTLQETGAVPDAVALLRRARQQFPGDFWINFSLAGASQTAPLTGRSRFDTLQSPLLCSPTAPLCTLA